MMILAQFNLIRRRMPELVSRSVLAVALTVCVTQLHASQSLFKSAPLNSWQTQVPDALAPVNQDKASLLALVDDGVLTYPQPYKTVRVNMVGRQKNQVLSKKAQFVSSAVVLNATPDQVKRTLSNYKNYPKLFPKMVSAKVLKQKKAQGVSLARVSYRVVIDIPVPILKFDETFTLKHQVKGNTLTTWIDYSPVKYGMGQFQWHAISAGKHKGKTLLTLTHWGQLDDMRGLVLPQIIKAMPSIKLGIPNGVNGYVLEALRLHFNGKDKPKTYAQSDIRPQWGVYADAKPALAKLLKHTQRLPVLYAHPPRRLKGQTTLRFVSSLQQMPAKPDAVNKWLMEPKRYPQLIKHIKKVTSKPHKQGELVTTKISLGLGVIAIPFRTKLYYQRPTKNHAVFSAAGGDVRWIEGEFKTMKQGKNASYLMTTIANKTDKSAPFLLRIGHSLPYNDYLSSVGAGAVLSHKVKKKLKK